MYRLICISLLLCASAFSQERLTDEEKKNLLAKVLEQEAVVIEGQERYQAAAIRDFSAALGSESEVFSLYLKCREKLLDEEETRSGSERRQIERRVRDNTTKEFKQALVHQLYFLRHSLEVKEKPELREAAAQKVLLGQTRVIQNIDSLSEEVFFRGNSPLKQNPFASPFAKAYQVEDFKPEKWPGHVLDFDGLYEQLIIPELIRKREYGKAREQWANRIKAESLIHLEHGTPAANKSEDPPSYDKFIQEQLPKLRWSLEETLFQEGDEKAAATGLFNILKTYPEHSSYLTWAKKLKDALQVVESTPLDAETPSGAETPVETETLAE